MKVELIKTKKHYIPSSECNFEHGTCSYFVKGEGRIKTKKVQLIEVDIPDTKDNLRDIAQTFSLYGKNVVYRYLVTNHAELWKDKMIQIACKYDLDEKSQQALNKLQKHIDCHIITFFDFFNNLDITSLDDRLVSLDSDYSALNCTYKDKEEISMADYIEIKLGSDVRELIKKLLGC